MFKCKNCCKDRGLIDVNVSICGSCFKGFTKDFENTKVFNLSGVDWVERDRSFAQEYVFGEGSCWVYDKVKDVICFVDVGGHYVAVRYLLASYYGHKQWFDIKAIMNIIGDNLIVYSAWCFEPEDYAERFIEGDD